MVNICVTVPATTTAPTLGVIRGLDKPDLIELRLDYSKEPLNLQTLRGSTLIPLIATVRAPNQGGLWRGSEDARRRLLLSTVEAGFNYIDVEAESSFLSELVEEAHESSTLVIISRHHMDRAPSLREILATHNWAKNAGADLVKIVGMARKLSDNLPCLEYLAQKPDNVSFMMGPLGVPSRILSPIIGGAFTYASAGEKVEVAPGQPTLSSIREMYRLMEVST